MPASTSPYFSVIVPTRNRSSLLAYALASVVNQTDTDFELIVSDNCSTDDTAEVARGFGQQREVKVVRPARALPMADHWNFALSHATGRWILLLGDDDYFSRDLLATIHLATSTSDTRVVTWHAGFYHHNVDIPASEMVYVPFGFNPAKLNKLDIMSWSGQTYALDARRQLQRLYSFENIVAPTGHVSALRADLIEEIVGWSGSLFHPPFPDFSCAASVLATADSMTYIDSPLHVLGRVPRLGKFNYLLSSEPQTDLAVAFAEEQESADMFEGQPIPSPRLITSHITASLECVRRLLPTSMRAIEFDWEQYFIRCQMEITSMKEADVAVDDLIEMYKQALAQQPLALQKAVRSKAGVRFPAFTHQVRRLKRSGGAHRLRRLLYQRRRHSTAFPDRADLPRWQATIDGAEAGFGDIAEATRHVDQLRKDGKLAASGR